MSIPLTSHPRVPSGLTLPCVPFVPPTVAREHLWSGQHSLWAEWAAGKRVLRHLYFKPVSANPCSGLRQVEASPLSLSEKRLGHL